MIGYSDNFIRISANGIVELIEKYQKKQRSIKRVARNAINETLKYGEQYVKQRAAEIKLPDERAAYEESYIVVAHNDGEKLVGSLKTDNPKATYAENGTGIVGSRHPHPAIQGWEYDVNKHGEAGWTYLASNGQFYHTKGIPAQKIYYETSTEMGKKLRELIIEKLKKE